ncbi:RinA family protein [Clostridioides sp. ES-S-0077-01]|uniref:RinA family protein n=1 Tax=Clostridioides sp. ES-S-0077-01 TaxID=2770782 RepID=UPI001D11C408|nr:DUF722 domain-containing protein [Clostridioides sp. ES-S-0077-01]
MEKVKCNEFKETETKLYNYNRLKSEIKHLELEIKNIEIMYMGCKGIECKEKIGLTYNINSNVENEVLEKENKIGQLQKKIIEKEIIVEKFDNAMSILNDNEVALVELRYFSRKVNSWDYVADSMGFSATRCKKMRNEIIDKIKDLLN